MNKRRRRMSRKTKKSIRKNLIFLIVGLLIICGVLYFVLFRGDSDSKSNVVEEISKYNYSLDDRDTILMRSVFRDLKTVLKEKNVDYKKYANYLCKLYVIDLYTINNKTSKYDVGGAEYVHPDGVENYKLQVGETMYRFIGSKSLPKKELPEVSEVTVKNITKDTYTYKNKEYSAYTMDVLWKYKKDLGYDTKATATLMKDGKKLYVVEFNPEESE